MNKIGIIINPYSKKIKRMKTDPVEFYKRIGGEAVEIRLTRNAEDIIKAAKNFKKQKIQYLAISGGDGSLHLVLSKFINVYKKSKLPSILILQDGSMNLVAKSYCLKGKGPDLLKRLIDKLNNNANIDIVYRNTLKVSDMYCFLFGMGISANYINEFNKGGNKNPLKAIKIILKGIFLAIFKEKNSGLFQRVKLTVTVDREKLRFNDFFGIFAATIANLAVSFKPCPRAYEKENAFHLIASGLKPSEFILKINKFRKGKPIKHTMHYDNIASELKITCHEKCLYEMDGDIYEAKGSLNVKLGPRISFVKI